jgi:hypothetical protein
MKTILIILLSELIICSYAWAGDLKDYDFLNQSEKVIALTILGEARGEGKSGMYAVACVIQKRSINRKLVPHMVCWQHKQFSVWNNKSVGDLAFLLDDSKQMWYAIELARAINRDKKFDMKYINNADHYCTLKVNPYWSYKTVVKDGKKIKVPIKPVKVIGNHKFYKLK